MLFIMFLIACVAVPVFLYEASNTHDPAWNMAALAAAIFAVAALIYGF